MYQLKQNNFYVNALGKVVVAHPGYKDSCKNTYKFGLVFYPGLHNSFNLQMLDNLNIMLKNQVPIGVVLTNPDINNPSGRFASVTNTSMLKYTRLDGTLETYCGPMTIKDIYNFAIKGLMHARNLVPN